MKDKVIRESQRGLTFSFTPTDKLGVGSRYDYVIEKDCIRIVPAVSGRYKVSRKRRKAE